MTGKTHFAVGIATGTAMVIYSVGINAPIYALGMITAPMGAMIPDIDHDMSKLGRNRKKIIRYLKLTIQTLLVIAVLVSIVGLITGTFRFALRYLITAVPVCIMVLVASSSRFKEKFPFLTKHRGIMHTLVAPICMMLGSMNIELDFIKALIVGCALGYISHLIADALTVTGTPLAFPVSTENVRFASIRTGTVFEYIGSGILMVAIVIYGYLVSKDQRNFGMIAVFMMYAFGYAIQPKAYAILRTVKRIKNAKIASIIIASIMMLIGVLLKGFCGYGIMGFGIGCLVSVFSKRIL